MTDTSGAVKYFRYHERGPPGVRHTGNGRTVTEEQEILVLDALASV